MNRNDSFEAKKVFSTELQNGKNPLEKTSKIYMGRILKRQRIPYFIRGDENEDAADLF